MIMLALGLHVFVATSRRARACSGRSAICVRSTEFERRTKFVVNLTFACRQSIAKTRVGCTVVADALIEHRAKKNAQHSTALALHERKRIISRTDMMRSTKERKVKHN